MCYFSEFFMTAILATLKWLIINFHSMWWAKFTKTVMPLVLYGRFFVLVGVQKKLNFVTVEWGIFCKFYL